MNNIKLRYYQTEAVDAAIFTMEQGENALLSIAQGCGKSIILAEIIRKLKQKKPIIRCVMFVPSANLLKQNLEEINSIAPDLKVGIFSASLNKKDLSKDITYSTYLSFNRLNVEKIPYVDFIIIDEVQNVSNKDVGSYREILKNLKLLNPNVKICGLSGTPYRNDGTGMITEGEYALFKDICYEYTLEQGINDGFLCPLTSKVSRQELDLSGVKIGSNKDYLERDLDMLMSNQEKVNTTAREALELAKDRHSLLWFCSSINHANMVYDKLKELGEKVAIVTGDTKQTERDTIFANYKSQQIRHIVSVDTLLVGINLPLTDCIVTIRPTKSTGLYAQAVCRGDRLHHSKTNCLILDFANWIKEHGSILDIKIKKKFNIETKKVENVVVKVLENTKMCPECRTVLKKTDLQCPICGYLYSKEEILNHNIKPSELDIMAKRTNYDIIEVNSYDLVPWVAKSGNMCIKEVFVTDFGNIMSFHAVNNYYTNKWLKEAINREDRDFVDIMDCEFDNNFDMFMSRFGQFNDIDSFTEFLNGIKPFFKTPTRIQAEKDGRYYKVIEIDYDTSIEKPEDNDFIV